MNTPKKKFGFGMMRLPLLRPEDNSSIDYEEVSRMVDIFMERGFNYFDTAMLYLGGMSEVAVGKCLTARYPRESFFLTDKISAHFLESQEEQEPKFHEQLKKCGVTYFDNYLVHNMSAANYPRAQQWKTFELVQSLKERGFVKHTGFSFHDTPELLEQILTEHPEIEFVQLQLNYIDWDSKGICSRECYEIAKRHGKKVIVMEPLKGGHLVSIPQEAKNLYEGYNPNASIASWGIRFAASHENVMMVLSGMSTPEQVRDNTEYMRDFKPFTEGEHEILKKAVDIINASPVIPCTGCGYCTDGCPKNIAIPQYFALYNGHKQSEGGAFTSHAVYYTNYIENFGKASDCIQCEQCEKACPQQLPVREHLKEIAKTFEDGQA